MAFCEKCGTKIDEGSKFCPSCGAPAPVIQPPEAQKPAPEQPKKDFTAKLQNLNNTADTTSELNNI